MSPCTQEEKIQEIYRLIADLRVSDAKKDEQIKSLVESVKSLVSWVKVLVGIATPAVITAIAFLVHYWVKGGA